MPVINLNEMKVERTIPEKIKHTAKNCYNWACDKVRNTVEYVKENPQGAAAIAGIVMTVTGGATKLVRSVNRHQAIRQEKFHREREIYDHSSNQYLVTKRKLRKDDIDRMNKLRREKGLKVSEALSELDLLKR